MELLTTLCLWLAIASPPDVSLDDLAAFPPRCVAVELTRATLRLRCEAEARKPLCHSFYEEWVAYRAACRETYRHWHVWSDLKEATDSTNSVEYRLSVLRRMREWLGEAYYHGEMPPPVPWGRVWR